MSDFVCIVLRYILALIVVVQRKPDAKCSRTDMMSFAPCGFNMAFLAGASCETRANYAGVSTGSVVACLLCCGFTKDQIRHVIKAFNAKCRYISRRSLVSQLGDTLDEILPLDAHVRCDGRLCVGITTFHIRSLLRATIIGYVLNISIILLFSDRNLQIVLIILSLAVQVLDMVKLRPYIKTAFYSRDELIRALQCSCSIPFIQDYNFREIDNHWCIDGGFSMSHIVSNECTRVGFEDACEIKCVKRAKIRLTSPPCDEEFDALFEHGILRANVEHNSSQSPISSVG